MSDTSAAFNIAVFDLDGGPLLLSDRALVLGGDPVYPAVLSWGNFDGDTASLTIEASALPSDLGFWVRRAVTVYEVPEGASSLYGASVLSNGIVDEEPSEQGGVLTVALGPARLRVQKVPAGEPISADVWPLAGEAALGQVLPEVLGTVERCAGLPVQLPKTTTLKAGARPNDRQLQVEDATAFAVSGSVRVDGAVYTYVSRDDTTFYGVAVTNQHRAGTAVSDTVEAVYLFAGHDLSALSEVRARDTLLSGFTTDLDAATVRFPTVPTIEERDGVENVTLNFDAVDESTTALNPINAIRAAVGTRTQSATAGTSIPVDLDFAVAYADAASGTVKAALDITIGIPPAVAGIYTFTVVMQPPENPEGSAVSFVTLGGVQQQISYTYPVLLSFEVPLTTGQTAIVLRHGSGPAPIAGDTINPGYSSLITSVVARLAASSGLPPLTSDRSEIVFDRPAPISGTDRIIAQAMTVGFSVAIAPGAAGRARVSIGGQLVWACDGETVRYNEGGGEVSLYLEEDTDRIPVAVEYESMLAGNVAVNITGAARIATLGNLDAANAATLRKSGNTVLAVTQTTVNPNRGKIKGALVAIEHETIAPAIDTVTVEWDGKPIGTLSLMNAGGGISTNTHTINVDTVNSGTATLANRAVTDIYSQSAAATDLQISMPVNAPIAYTPKVIGSASAGIIYYALNTRVSLPANVVAGSYTFSLGWESPEGGSNPNALVYVGGAWVNQGDASVTVPLSAGQQYLTITHKRSLFDNELYSLQDYKLKYISGVVTAKPTQNAISVSGGGFTGSPQLASSTAPNAGVSSKANINGTGTGTLTTTDTGPKRTVVNAFALPFIRDWSDLTGKTLKLTYGGSGTYDIEIVEASIAVEYEPVTLVPAIEAGAITATVTGRSGNPADVLRFVAEAAGERVDVTAWRRLQLWCAAAGFQLGRRLAEPQDAATLLAEAADVALVDLASRPDGLAFVRRLDDGWPLWEIIGGELMAEAAIEWASPDQVYNDLTLRYRHIDGAPTRALVRNSSSPDRWAARSERELGERQSMEIASQSQWLANDTSAALFASDWMRLNAPMRRKLTLPLPFTFADMAEGDLIAFRPLSLFARVLSISTDDAGFITVTAWEIPA